MTQPSPTNDECRRQVDVLLRSCVAATRVSFVAGGLSGLLVGVLVGRWLGSRANKETK